MAQNIIEVSQNFGSAFGYTCSLSDEYIGNYLSQLKVDKKQIKDITRWLRDEFGSDSKIAILRNIEINERQQGKGLGKALLTEFISQASSHGSSCLIVIADLDQSQRKGFKLSDFYRRSGFSDTEWFYELGLMIRYL